MISYINENMLQNYHRRCSGIVFFITLLADNNFWACNKIIEDIKQTAFEL